jgi:hypothetical protein
VRGYGAAGWVVLSDDVAVANGIVLASVMIGPFGPFTALLSPLLASAD